MWEQQCSPLVWRKVENILEQNPIDSLASYYSFDVRFQNNWMGCCCNSTMAMLMLMTGTLACDAGWDTLRPILGQFCGGAAGNLPSLLVLGGDDNGEDDGDDIRFLFIFLVNQHINKLYWCQLWWSSLWRDMTRIPPNWHLGLSPQRKHLNSFTFGQSNEGGEEIAMAMSFVIVANIRTVSRFSKVFVLSPWWWPWRWWWWYLRFSLFWKVNPPTSVCLTHFTCLKCLPANWFGVKFHIFPGLEPHECPATEV